MEWSELAKKINNFKDKFEKSYKCVNKNAPIRVETLIHHIKILVLNYNNIVQLYLSKENRLTEQHVNQCKKIIKSLGTRISYISTRHNIVIDIPTDLKLMATFEPDQLKELNESKPTLDNDPDIEADSDIEPLELAEPNMAVTQVALDREYVRQVSSTIPEFDGKKLSLARFLTALRLVDRTKGTQEDLAVEVIKSKIIGPTLYKVQNETSIIGIINKLNTNIKGESTDVIKAKLLNIKQKGKSASQYTAEIDSLRKQLEAAYIDDGLDFDNAEKFSTKETISAMTKNCDYEKLRIILEAGNFSNFNDAMGKYIQCSTEMTGSPSTVLYYKGRNDRGNYSRNNQRGRGNSRGNGNFHYNGNNNNRGNFRGNYRGGNRGRNNSNRGGYQNQNSNNRGNVRVTQGNSENQQTPSDVQSQ